MNVEAKLGAIIIRHLIVKKLVVSLFSARMLL